MHEGNTSCAAATGGFPIHAAGLLDLRWSLMNGELYRCHILGTSHFALQVCFCSATLLAHVYKVPVKSLGSNREKCVEYRMLNLKGEEHVCGYFHISHATSVDAVN